MGLKFPPDESVGAQHTINIHEHSYQALTQSGGDVFPIVIRLESLMEDGVQEGRSLNEVRWG